MLGIEEKSRVYVYKDKITMDFLRSLKKRREALGYTRRELGQMVGIPYASISCYEILSKLPSLKRLIALADFFDVDISESINWKIINAPENLLRNTKDLVKRYAFSQKELANEINKYPSNISYASQGSRSGSLLILGSIVEVLEREKQSEKFRNELLKKSRNKRRKLNAKIQSEV